ncbi:hypothetical protein AAFF_G00102260 [Aldrovandia affinis]|uniref:C2H2-type domain-containing protein n=1 Tax=Aldrovandia affinis TaxID=143900 RepID=A0AAD7RUT2_9TELE|nr:hypothetical protein AAFF_G00102260 [Aldrovandia affinis]
MKRGEGERGVQTLRLDCISRPLYFHRHSGAKHDGDKMTYNAESRFENEEVPRRYGKSPFVTKDPLHKCVLVSKLEHHSEWESEPKEEIKQEENEHTSTRADYMEEDHHRFILETSTDLNSTLHYVSHRVSTAEGHDGSSTCATTLATEGDHATLTPIHTQEITYQRSHCGKSFNTKGDLEIPQTHITESCYFQQVPLVGKSYLCAHCGKSFATITNYFVHLQIHRGERPFSCSQCGKSYYKEESLKTHQQSHRGKHYKTL